MIILIRMEHLIVPNNILLSEVCSLLEEGKEVWLKAKGCSMLPFIRGDKDSVLLSGNQEIYLGDIVLALLEGNRYVLHRVVGLEGENVILMGDGNVAGQEKCMLKDVKAIALMIDRGEKIIEVRSVGHQKIAAVWKLLLPLRRYLLALYGKIYKK